MKLYIPNLGDKIRLTAPLEIDDAAIKDGFGGGINQSAAWRIVKGDAPWDWKAIDAGAVDKFVLEEGTVLEFRRYFVNASAKTKNIEVGIFAHPRRDLTPKRQGGTSLLIKLTLPTWMLNQIEFEEVEL